MLSLERRFPGYDDSNRMAYWQARLLPASDDHPHPGYSANLARSVRKSWKTAPLALSYGHTATEGGGHGGLLLAKACGTGTGLEDHVALAVEARILASLDRHPHITKLVGFITTGAPAAILTEVPAGGRLRSYLRTQCDRLVPRQLRQLCEGVASAMAYLESLAIVHRGLSLDAVVVGQGPEDAKLQDFGKRGLMPLHFALVCP